MATTTWTKEVERDGDESPAWVVLAREAADEEEVEIAAGGQAGQYELYGHPTPPGVKGLQPMDDRTGGV